MAPDYSSINSNNSDANGDLKLCGTHAYKYTPIVVGQEIISLALPPNVARPVAMPKQHWMVKQEPTAYSWEQFVKDKVTAWTGVRNFQARNNLRAMKTGDLVLFYHSVVGKEVVGIAKVVRTAYPDSTADEPGWDCVDLAPVRAFTASVTLENIKGTAALKNISLLKQSRLSVMPLTAAEFEIIVTLGKGE